MKPKTRWTLTFVVLIILINLFILWNLRSGSVSMTWREIASALFHRGENTLQMRILWDIRLPRLASSAILGGALAVAGFLMQTFFHNPIVGPYVLGISSGAKLAVALVMIASLSFGKTAGSGMMILAAFGGAGLSMAFVLLAARKVRRMSVLVICGVMIGYICSAITEFVVTFASDANIVNLHNWSQGSFSGQTWENVRMMSIAVFPALLCAFFLSKPISVYQQGEEYARNVGVNIRMLGMFLILISTILSACVTAFAGPVSFVGIAVPHLVRNLLHSEKPILMIPACLLGGAVFCMGCDLIARMLFSPTELNIGAVTAVLGAPVVIAMLIGRQKGHTA